MNGKAVLVKANTGTEQAPEYTAILGQKGCTLSIGTDTTDTTTKDSGNWSENAVTYNNWSVSFDGLLKETDPALTAVRTEQKAGNQVLVQVEMPDGSKQEGLASITSFEIDAPHDDEVSYSCELEGSGELKDIAAPAS